jgi:hypothetical protein
MLHLFYSYTLIEEKHQLCPMYAYMTSAAHPNNTKKCTVQTGTVDHGSCHRFHNLPLLRPSLAVWWSISMLLSETLKLARRFWSTTSMDQLGKRLGKITSAIAIGPLSLDPMTTTQYMSAQNMNADNQDSTTTTLSKQFKSRKPIPTYPYSVVTSCYYVTSMIRPSAIDAPSSRVFSYIRTVWEL